MPVEKRPEVVKNPRFHSGYFGYRLAKTERFVGCVTIATVVISRSNYFVVKHNYVGRVRPFRKVETDRTIINWFVLGFIARFLNFAGHFTLNFKSVFKSLVASLGRSDRWKRNRVRIGREKTVRFGRLRASQETVPVHAGFRHAVKFLITPLWLVARARAFLLAVSVPPNAIRPAESIFRRRCVVCPESFARGWTSRQTEVFVVLRPGRKKKKCIFFPPGRTEPAILSRDGVRRPATEGAIYHKTIIT